MPETRKQRVFAILARMDDAIGDFFRGRLVIAIITGVLLSVGWFLVGVPYWFFLGMFTGFLIIVPYLSIIIWPVAIILKYVDTLTGSMAESGGIMTVVVWPSVVFGVVQFLGGLGSNTVDPERSDQSERRYNHSRRFHRRVGGRRIGNAAGHPGSCMHQDIFRRGRATALKEMGCDPLKATSPTANTPGRLVSRRWVPPQDAGKLHGAPAGIIVLMGRTSLEGWGLFQQRGQNISFKALRAAKYPHIPCTPPPGGVDAEQI